MKRLKRNSGTRSAKAYRGGFFPRLRLIGCPRGNLYIYTRTRARISILIRLTAPVPRRECSFPPPLYHRTNIFHPNTTPLPISRVITNRVAWKGDSSIDKIGKYRIESPNIRLLPNFSFCFDRITERCYYYWIEERFQFARETSICYTIRTREKINGISLQFLGMSKRNTLRLNLDLGLITRIIIGADW